MKNRGSVTIALLLLFSGIMMLLMRHHHEQSLFLEVIVRREQYERQFWLAEGLLECGVALCTARWQDIVSRAQSGGKNSIRFTVAPWPPGNTQASGRVVVENRSPESVLLTAELVEKNNVLLAHRCCIEKQGDGSFLCSGWEVV